MYDQGSSTKTKRANKFEFAVLMPYSLEIDFILKTSPSDVAEL